MISPNKLSRSPFPAKASQWMLVGLRGGAAVGGPVDPSTIAGLRLWLKADAITAGSLLRGLLIDRLTPDLEPKDIEPKVPPADGASITTWIDSSGNAQDFTQGNAGFRPLFRTNMINGLPAVKFDGIDDFLTSPSIPATITTSATIFMVQRKNANSGNTAIMAAVNPGLPSPATNSFTIFLPYSDNNVYFDLGDSTGTGRISGAWGGDYTNFFVWSFVAGAGNMAVYRNGTTVVSSGGHTNNFVPTGLILVLSGIAGLPQNADVAEILIYNNALSTTDRQAVENYLKTKYAIT